MRAGAVGISSARSARANLHDVAPVQALERKQDLTGLAPKSGLVTTEPIEGIGRQVGQADKRPREVVELIRKGRRSMSNLSSRKLARPDFAVRCLRPRRHFGTWRR
jgi:triosephosphate isomerase